MRQRISCLVLILALTVPAAGWARGSIIDPDGASNDLVVETTGGETPGWSLFHRFISWLDLERFFV